MKQSAYNLLSDVNNTILDCRTKIESGNDVDVQLIQNKVVELCDIVTKLSEEDAREFKPHLEEVVTKLDEIAHLLGLRKEQVMQQVQDIETRKKANQAYTPNNLKSNKEDI